MRHAKPTAAPSRSVTGVRGNTLVEVLVALVVLSLGLLGLASQQMLSLRSGRSAYYVTQATTLANDLAERMRSNRSAALAGDYDASFMDTPPDCGVIVAGAATPAQDIASWRNALACVLPQGNGQVESNDTKITITIEWDDSRGEEAPLQFQLVTAL
jgi:type IV pilus assembly protein PilV